MGSPLPPNGVIWPTVQKSCLHEAVRAFRRHAFRAVIGSLLPCRRNLQQDVREVLTLRHEERVRHTRRNVDDVAGAESMTVAAVEPRPERLARGRHPLAAITPPSCSVPSPLCSAFRSSSTSSGR